MISGLWQQSSSRRDAKRDLRRINTRAVKISYLKSRAGWNFRAEKNRRATSNLWSRHWFGCHLSFIQRPCRMPNKAQKLFIHGPIYRRFSPISRRLVTASIVDLFVVCQSIRNCLPSSVVSHLQCTRFISSTTSSHHCCMVNLLHYPCYPSLTRLPLFYDYTRIYSSWMCSNFISFTACLVGGLPFTALYIYY